MTKYFAESSFFLLKDDSDYDNNIFNSNGTRSEVLMLNENKDSSEFTKLNINCTRVEVLIIMRTVYKIDCNCVFCYTKMQKILIDECK